MKQIQLSLDPNTIEALAGALAKILKDNAAAMVAEPASEPAEPEQPSEEAAPYIGYSLPSRRPHIVDGYKHANHIAARMGLRTAAVAQVCKNLGLFYGIPESRDPNSGHRYVKESDVPAINQELQKLIKRA